MSIKQLLAKAAFASLAVVGVIAVSASAVSAHKDTNRRHWPHQNSSSNIVVVRATDLEDSKVDAFSNGKWFFYNDEDDTVNNTLGSFVTGPATTPFGVGSAQISVTGTERRLIATYTFAGTPFEDIKTLAFSTYNPSAGNGGSANRSAYLNINVDFDGSDTWQRRLIFLPSDNGTVQQDTWQEWDAVGASGSALWRYSGATWPVDGVPGTTPKTLNQLITQYPGIRIRVSDPFVGLRVGEPYADGYTENIDGFKFGTDSETTTYDFEPAATSPSSKDDCKDDGWMNFSDPTFENQGQCIKYVNRMNHHDDDRDEHRDHRRNKDDDHSIWDWFTRDGKDDHKKNDDDHHEGRRDNRGGRRDR